MDNTKYVPVPHFPPFQLRSSLVDKDPVIWVHLLESYIKLCEVLLTGEVKLDIKSQQQFQHFLKIYLKETSEEKSKIFSLGAINPDITSNTAVLRTRVFQIICDYGAVKLGLSGESLWNFVIIYIEHNASFVRGIITGSYKSKFNDNKKSGKISSVQVLRKYIISLIAESKLSNFHLKTLSILIGQHVAAPSTKKVHVTSAGKAVHTSKTLARDKYKHSTSSAILLAELFVNEDWIEELESMYAGGKSVNADMIKNCMAVSVLSLSVSKLAKVISTIGIYGRETFILAPLLSAIILSDAYKSLNPGLEERLPFLRNIHIEMPETYAEADIEFLIEMFPNLTVSKVKKLLSRYENKIDQTTNALLENPLLMEEVSDSEDNKSSFTDVPATKPSKAELEKGINRFKLSSNETNQTFGKRTIINDASELKKKTLTAALSLLYDSDEDERDDTYDDQEHTSGQAITEGEGKFSFKSKDTFHDDALDGRSSRSTIVPEFDPIEMLLFGYLKSGGDDLFDKQNRKSKQRKDMKEKTSWSDEQIEGWSRMLKRSSKRFRLMEEHYVFSNSNRRSANVQKQESDKPAESDIDQSSRHVVSDRNAQKRKETNKAKKANHSRKSGHKKKTQAELAGMQ